MFELPQNSKCKAFLEVDGGLYTVYDRGVTYWDANGDTTLISISQTPPFESVVLNSIASNGTRTVVCGDSFIGFFDSDNPTVLTAVEMSKIYARFIPYHARHIRQIIFKAPYFIMLSWRGNTDECTIFRSTDGQMWEEFTIPTLKFDHTPPLVGQFTAVVQPQFLYYEGDRFFLAALVDHPDYGSCIFESLDDGETWQSVYRKLQPNAINFTARMREIIKVDDTYHLFFSSDESIGNESAAWSKVRSTEDFTTFVDNSLFAISQNALTDYTNKTRYVDRIIRIGTQFVGVGGMSGNTDSRCIATSTDLSNWQITVLPDTFAIDTIYTPPPTSANHGKIYLPYFDSSGNGDFNYLFVRDISNTDPAYIADPLEKNVIATYTLEPIVLPPRVTSPTDIRMPGESVAEFDARLRFEYILRLLTLGFYVDDMIN